MPKPLDAATRQLLAIDPVGWLEGVGLPVTGPVRVIDSDLSTITAEADAVFQVGEPADYLAHFEIQSGHDRSLPGRLLHYNVLLHHRHQKPVRSVAVLLDRRVNSPSITGRHRVLLPDGSCYLDFRYTTVRPWTMDVESFLTRGLGIVPLAPLAKVRKQDLPAVIDRIKTRFDREVSKEEAGLLWTATAILMGYRYSDELVASLLRGIPSMKESTTYQAILREGRAEGVRSSVLLIGRMRLGEPSMKVVDRLNAITDEATLSALLGKVVKVPTWDELLSGP